MLKLVSEFRALHSEVLYICVGFWMLAHLTRDWSQAENTWSVNLASLHHLFIFSKSEIPSMYKIFCHGNYSCMVYLWENCMAYSLGWGLSTKTTSTQGEYPNPHFGFWFRQRVVIKSPPYSIWWFEILWIFPVEN